nr:RNA-directed DNA polymerase, eukaryota [Tanacetum cinerariifolium]
MKLVETIFESFKIITQGKVFWARAKECISWIPDFVEDDAEESDSDDEIRDGELHDESACMHNHTTMKGESDVEEVSKTIFENEQYQAHKKDDLNVRQDDIRLEDPFNIYDLLNKKQDNIIKGSSSDNMKHPPGFTPMVATEVQSNAFKKSKIEGEWVSNGTKLLIISVYALQELSEKTMLWHYLTLVIDNWNGADAFNLFIPAAGLEEVPLDGIWIDSPCLVKSEFLSHFTNRFDQPQISRLQLDTDFPNKLNLDQHVKLENNVTHEEIRRAVWDYGADKSPRPDGFTFGFYRRYWNFLEKDVDEAIYYFFTMGHSLKVSHSNIDTIVEVLECFYRVSGLRINMNKIKLMGILAAIVIVDQAAVKIGCTILEALSLT